MLIGPGSSPVSTHAKVLQRISRGGKMDNFHMGGSAEQEFLHESGLKPFCTSEASAEWIFVRSRAEILVLHEPPWGNYIPEWLTSGYGSF